MPHENFYDVKNSPTVLRTPNKVLVFLTCKRAELKESAGQDEDWEKKWQIVYDSCIFFNLLLPNKNLCIILCVALVYYDTLY